MGARLIEIIEAVETRGEGKDMYDPCRRVVKYYSKNGDLLAEKDDHDIEILSRITETEIKTILDRANN